MGLIEKIVHYIYLIPWTIVALIVLLIFLSDIKQLLRKLLAIVDRSKRLTLGPFSMEYDLVQLDRREEPADPNFAQIGADDKSAIAARANQLLVEAVELSNARNHHGALKRLREANQLLPSQWPILHFLGAVLIRIAISTERIEYAIEAVNVCQSALHLSERFPYGTYYNVARAQALARDIIGLQHTFFAMKEMNMPDNLREAIAEGDLDFERHDFVRTLPEYLDLKAFFSHPPET